MLHELSNDPIQRAIARLEKQHEEDKQVWNLKLLCVKWNSIVSQCFFFVFVNARLLLRNRDKNTSDSFNSCAIYCLRRHRTRPTYRTILFGGAVRVENCRLAHRRHKCGSKNGHRNGTRCSSVRWDNSKLIYLKRTRWYRKQIFSLRKWISRQSSALLYRYHLII